MLNTPEKQSAFVNNAIIIANIVEVVQCVVRDISFKDSGQSIDSASLNSEVIRNIVVSKLNHNINV